MAGAYVKQRGRAAPGSIPERLESFSREVRFYQEVAAHVGVRVPACQLAEVGPDGGTRLELEDLSAWSPGAEPEAAAATLRGLHDSWQGSAVERWPWLPRPYADDLVDELFSAAWPSLRERRDLSREARELGDRLVGRVAEVERDAAAAGPTTLTHGDASTANMRTSPSGVVALLDWEDYGAGPGVADLAWHLVSSVEPRRWDAAIDAYGASGGLEQALPAAVVQALLSLSDDPDGDPAARRWVSGATEAARRL
jgi:hypothetical protein